MKRKIEFTENNLVEEMVSLKFSEAPILKIGDKYLRFNEAIEYLNKE